VLVSLDKLDKIGWQAVSAELESKGLGKESVTKLRSLLEDTDLDGMEAALGGQGREAIAELRELFEVAHALGVGLAHLRFDPVLARGLGYYTGPVFEAQVTEPKVGSIAGGGRYDGLVGVFSKRDLPAVGISLGLERILVVMEELGMMPGARSMTQLFVTVFSAELRSASLELARLLRAAGVSVELSLTPAKLGAQFKRANALGVPWVAVIGPAEAEQGMVQLKHLQSGEQQTLGVEALIAKLKGATEAAPR
jgi:histidyl-tRNA synthetase